MVSLVGFQLSVRWARSASLQLQLLSQQQQQQHRFPNEPRVNRQPNAPLHQRSPVWLRMQVRRATSTTTFAATSSRPPASQQSPPSTKPTNSTKLCQLQRFGTGACRPTSRSARRRTCKNWPATKSRRISTRVSAHPSGFPFPSFILPRADFYYQPDTEERAKAAKAAKAN